MGMFGKSRNLFAGPVSDGGSDPRDQTANYNTPLQPHEEAAFQQWRQRLPRDLQNMQDYDLRGAWKANAQEAGNGHLPDTWKKPNHTTFSDGSIYAGPENPPGNWVERPDGGWIYFASPGMSKYRTPNALQNYFSQYEKGNDLVLPQNALNVFARPRR